jgi:hypothetical protein
MTESLPSLKYILVQVPYSTLIIGLFMQTAIIFGYRTNPYYVVLSVICGMIFYLITYNCIGKLYNIKEFIGDNK